MPFSNINGLYALLGLVPFIVLYLIRPKPQDRTIPSLMFLIKDQKKAIANSLFQKLMRNLLFLIQLLIILALCFSIAEPYFNTNYDIESTHTVIVLDASGSMQAASGGNTRFGRAVEKAKGRLSKINTIILAEEIPLVIVENEEKALSLEILASLRPKATKTNLGDAMIIAKGILNGKDGRVVVISDFSKTDGPDIFTIEKAMASQGTTVEFIPVSDKAENVGIIGLEITKRNTKAFVKNFNDEEKEVSIKLIQGSATKGESKLKIAPHSVESIVFDTPEEVSEIQLEPKDDFDLDNKAYISNIMRTKAKVLLVTNAAKTSLESSLLASPDIELSIVNPPVLTITTKREKIDSFKQDIVIIHQVNKKDILPGTFEDFRRYVEKGGKLIITAQSDLSQINTINLNPVAVGELTKEPARACMEIFNEFTRQFEKEGCFAAISSHLKGEAIAGATKIASSGNDAIIAIASLKAGTIMYYGIIDRESDFSTLPSYPIFWSDLVNFLVKSEKVEEYNLKTGRVMSISKQEVKTPSGEITTDKLVMDEQGIYEFDKKKFALNLLDADESDITSSSSVFSKSEDTKSPETEKVQTKLNLDILLIGISFLLLLFETAYIKIRGDI